MSEIAAISNPDSPPSSNPSAFITSAKSVPGFFDRPNEEQIYNVVHHATGQRKAAILLCGPIGAERERSYPTLVKWAHMLSAKGCDTMRFDYRGIGESSGQFERMTLTNWLEDAAFCADRLAEASPGVPLILHGTRAGALIAAELFASGIGDALQLWAPPTSGQALLWDTLRRNLAAQMVSNPDSPRRTRDQLVAALEAGELINVDGYFWSRKLWADAQLHALALPPESEPRPWHIARIGNLAKSTDTIKAQGLEDHIRTNPFWEESQLFCPSKDELFQLSLRWIETSILMHGKAS